MLKFSDQIVDDSGYRIPVEGASVYLSAKDGTLATGFSPNPAPTDSYGYFTFTGADGLDGAYVYEARVGGVTIARGQTLIGVVPDYVGKSGPANSSYGTLATMKAAPATYLSYILGTANGPVTYSYVTGDFTGQADDVSIIKLDAVPINAGALVRQGAASIGYAGITVFDKLFERISVKESRNGLPGAKGNGAADDTDAIQRTIDYVSSLGGGVVFVPRGVYRLRYRQSSADWTGLTCLRIPSHVHLVGEGWSSHLRVQDNDPVAGTGAAATVIRHSADIENVTIRDIQINGNIPNNPKLSATNPMINGANISFGVFDGGTCKGVHIYNVYSHDSYGQGIQVVGQNAKLASNIWIENNLVERAGYIGIQGSRGKGFKIRGNTIDTTKDNGIDVYGDPSGSSTASIFYDYDISGNTCRAIGGAAVFLETVGQGNTYGNIGDGTVNGIHCNVISIVPKGLKIYGNQMRNMQNTYVVTGPVFADFFDNQGTNFSIAGLRAGTPGGESSFYRFERFMFEPPSNSVPCLRIDNGVNAHNFVDCGLYNLVTDPDQANPYPQTQYRVVQGSPTIANSPFPIFRSATSANGIGARMRNPLFEGTPQFQAPLVVYADNPTALAALGAGRDYKRAADGPTYRTY